MPLTSTSRPGEAGGLQHVPLTSLNLGVVAANKVVVSPPWDAQAHVCSRQSGGKAAEAQGQKEGALARSH